VEQHFTTTKNYKKTPKNYFQNDNNKQNKKNPANANGNAQ